jgi:hypothetical protein
MSGEASTTSRHHTLEGELAALADAHTALADALRRLFNAIASGAEALITIERLRLENCADLYRHRAADLQAAFDLCASQAAEHDWSDESEPFGSDKLLLPRQSPGGDAGDRPVTGERDPGYRGHEARLQQADFSLAEAEASAAQ